MGNRFCNDQQRRYNFPLYSSKSEITSVAAELWRAPIIIVFKHYKKAVFL
jgi:hypothetical protein